MTAMQTSPVMSRWSSGGLVTAPETSIHVGTVLPFRVPAGAGTSPVRGGRPGGRQRASTQVICTEV